MKAQNFILFEGSIYSVADIVYISPIFNDAKQIVTDPKQCQGTLFCSFTFRLRGDHAYQTIYSGENLHNEDSFNDIAQKRDKLIIQIGAF